MPSSSRLSAALCRIALVLLLVPLMLSGCGGDSLPAGKEQAMEVETFSFGKLMYGKFDEYRIVPGDQLDVLFNITTWEDTGQYRIGKDDELSVKFPNDPRLNETQPVRPDGTISLPYLGEIRVAGRTIADVSRELQRHYARILKNPDVYVTVPQFMRQLRELKADLHTNDRGLSRLVTVRPDGVATFPMVGHVPVAGRTVEAVNKDLNGFYRQISPNFRVDLFLEKHSGSVVYVMGEVQRPGAYQISRPVTVFEALALAGGASRQSKNSSIVVIRRDKDRMVARKVDTAAALAGKDGAKLFALMPDDIVFVPRGEVFEMADIMQAVAGIILFRGWGVTVGWDPFAQ